MRSAVKGWSANSVAIFGGGFVEEGFVWSLVIETRSRAVVEQILNRSYLVMGDSPHGSSFGIELSDQAVCVFIRTALMGATRISHIHFDPGISLESTAIGKLRAVVKRHTASVISVDLCQALPDSLVNVASVFGFNSGDNRVARFAVDQCHQTSAVC